MKMRTTKWITMGSILALAFLGCSSLSRDTSKVLVNAAGTKITQAQFEEVVRFMIGDDKRAEELLKSEPMKEQRNQFLESLAMQKAMVEMAKGEGLDRDPRVKVLLEQRAAQVYLQVLTDRRMAKTEPTEADLRALYDSLVEQRKAAGQGQGVPAYEDVKAQMPSIWKQKQEQTVTENLFKELRQKYPLTFAEGYQPAPQPAQP